jgi:eukaryotic-like serine/threonine-protein kinase
VIIADRSDPELAAVSATRARKTDQVCDCFEAAWRSGQRPQIEDFLNDASEPSRSLLLRELVGLDVAYRRMRGESPRLSEYRGRFPERAGAWLTHAMDGTPEPSDHRPARSDRTAATDAGGTLDVAAAGVSDRTDPASVPWQRPRKLGKFELIERVGVGAFGSVWRARDLQLGRVVAVKVPHTELIECAQDLERIYREARTVAQLRHPGIVSVHEVCVHEGLPILVSDFVVGTSLRDLLIAGRPSNREAAALVAKVADALGYAHALGAIHRDIKPANIMIDDESAEAVVLGHEVSRKNAGAPPGRRGRRPPHISSSAKGTDSRGLGEPRIVDFGLAFRDNESAHLTQAGQLVGTPAYMSPEQAGDGIEELDGRADVYSLGVVLYETLSGVLPFVGTRSEILRQLAHDEPRRLRQVDRRISRDLETICHKAMAKDPRQRFETARELADDLRRYLDGEPIRARPVRMWERIWRHARRRPAEAAALAMVGVTALAVVGLGVGTHYHIQLLYEYDRTDQARQAEATERRRAETYLYYNRMALAEREFSAHNIERVKRLLEDCPPRLRRWEWSYLQRQCHQELLTVRHVSTPPQSHTVTRVAFSPDGRQLATACRDGLIRLWNSSDGSMVRTFDEPNPSALTLAFHPGGSRIASSGIDGRIKIWDCATGRLLRTLNGHAGTVYCVAYSPDGHRLAAGDGFPPWEAVEHLRTPGIVKVWNEATGDEFFTLRGHTQNVMGMEFSPDGRRLATVSGAALAVPLVANKPGELLIWDVQNGTRIRAVHGHDGPLTSVAYSPDGKTLATSSWDRTVKLWDAETGARLSTLTGHHDWVCHVAFDPAGSRLATAGADGAIHLWSIATGRSLLTFRGHTQKVTCVTFDPQGRRLASASSDQTVKLWDSTVNREAYIWRSGAPVVQLAFFPDSRRLIVAGNHEAPDGRLRPILTVLDPRTGHAVKLRGEHLGPGKSISGLALDGTGTRVAVSFGDTMPEVRDAETGATVKVFETSRQCQVQGLAFSPDGATVALTGLGPRSDDGEPPAPSNTDAYLAAWDMTTGRNRWSELGSEPGKIRSVDFSPDGRLIATADNESSVTLRDATNGAIIRRLSGHRRLVSCVAFSPDGHRLASASWDQTARIWDVVHGQVSVVLRGHMRSVLCVAFSPDGTRVATGSEDQTVKLWDAATGEEVLTLRGHTGLVSSVAFSPDGRLFASAGTDGVVQVRESETASVPDVTNPISD